LGTGNLRWNVISHIIIGVLNLLFCFIAGYFFRNGLYVIFSWILALIIGSSIIIFEYHSRNEIPLNTIFGKVFIKLFGFLLLLLLLSYFVNNYISSFALLVGLQSALIVIYYLLITTKISELKENIIFILQTKKLKQ
jgi:hypothetical protein